MEPIDKKTAKLIESTHRNCKAMPLLCILGLFVPIILPFIVPLCLLYASRRKRLLKQVEGVDLSDSQYVSRMEDSVETQVEYLRENGGRFYLPIYAAVGAAIVLTVLIMLT